MSQRILSVMVVAAIGWCVESESGHALQAAEYRTSVRGQPVVRPATYQAAESSASRTRVPQMARRTGDQIEVLSDPALPGSVDWSEPVTDGCCANPQADCLDSCWEGSCGPSSPNSCCGWTCWGSVEFLLWWRKSQDMPPLVTTSPDGTAANMAGVLGAADTQVLFPTESQNGDARAGGRLTLGIWFDAYESAGLGARLYSLGETTASFAADSDSYAILARPFHNLTLNEPDADVVVFPTFTTGGISVSNVTRIGGGDVFLRRMLFRDDCHQLDLISGYQFAKIDSDLLIASNRRSIRQEGSIPFGTVIQMHDLFDTTNRYHAGEIGFLGTYDRDQVTWSLLAKVGLGRMKQRTEIAGGTTTAVPQQPVIVTDQGLLALGTNVGIYEQNRFTVSPELQLTAAYHLTDAIDLTFGYSFIYWNHVAQPADQIDEIINTTQITGALVGDARPAFPNQDSDFFVQGMSVGIQWVW
ncbi:MAG: BBP7 family outer membrane beta-barrel protein [Pirellulaceae bacterium]